MKYFGYINPNSNYTIIVFAIVLCVLLIYILCGGCWPSASPPAEPFKPPTQIIREVIHSTNWLFSGGIIVVFLGTVAGLHGLKSGWLVVIAAILSLSLKAAFSVVWLYWVLACLGVAGLLLVIAGILWKNTALKEIIVGVQEVKTQNNKNHTYKNIFGDHHVDKIGVNQTLKSTQTKSTQKLVQKIKGKLKKNGGI